MDFLFRQKLWNLANVAYYGIRLFERSLAVGPVPEPLLPNTMVLNLMQNGWSKPLRPKTKGPVGVRHNWLT